MCSKCYLRITVSRGHLGARLVSLRSAEPQPAWDPSAILRVASTEQETTCCHRATAIGGAMSGKVDIRPRLGYDSADAAALRFAAAPNFNGTLETLNALSLDMMEDDEMYHSILFKLGLGRAILVAMISSHLLNISI
jgi:hypothetical protein